MKLVTTEIEEQKVDVRDLAPGMYVCRLDRPWTFALFTLIPALSLLAYPVVAVFNVCVLAAFGHWRWRQAADSLGGC